MKKYIKLIILLNVIGTYSCSKDNIIQDNKPPKPISTLSRTQGDGKYETLGYSYDITDDYMGTTAVHYPVIDVEAFVKDMPERFDNPFIGYINTRIFAGSDAESFQKDIIENSNFQGSVGDISKKEEKNQEKGDGTFSASITTGFGAKTSYSYSSKYSFARADVYKKQRRYYLDASISTLSQYLTTNFKEDLNTYSANQLIQKYGTHILTDITIGGVYSMYYKSVIYESMSSEEKKKSVKGGATYLLNAIGLGISGSWDKTEIEKRYKKNSTWECNIKSLGGNTSGTTITLPANQEPSISIDFGSWSASVDDTHSVLIDVDWNKTYPIYELISDPQKKEELKKATEDYIMSKSIEVLPTACVYRYYNGKDHYYTTVYKEAFDEWKFECTQFSIYTQKVENTIPLYQYWGDGDHFYTTKYFPNGVDNRKYENIVGYVFPSSQKGSIPLFRYWNSHLPDHFYTIYNSIFTDYIYEGIECYVLPNE